MTDSKKSKSDAVDQDLIRDLANLLSETELSEIEVEQNGLRLRVARQFSGSVATVAAAHAQASAAAPAGDAPAAGGNPADHPGAVTSPMVGTVYLSPEPGAAQFIAEGQQVSEGQTLVIIEAMKTMNAIPAPRSGTITKILVGNEQPIEFGEAMVIIE